MTYQEKIFIEEVEKNRGVIKNKAKYYPMICDIEKYGILEWKLELSFKKNFGISFIHDICTKLNTKDQRTLCLDIFDGSKITIAGAKLKLMKYL